MDEDEPDTFGRGLTDLSLVADTVFIPWSEAVAGQFDLAIAASRAGGDGVVLHAQIAQQACEYVADVGHRVAAMWREVDI